MVLVTIGFVAVVPSTIVVLFYFEVFAKLLNQGHCTCARVELAPAGCRRFALCDAYCTFLFFMLRCTSLVSSAPVEFAPGNFLSLTRFLLTVEFLFFVYVVL